jgi:hypothetical protein
VTVTLEETGFTKKIQTQADVPVNLFRPTSQGGAGLPDLALTQVPLYSQPVVLRSEFGPTGFQQASPPLPITNAAGRYSTIVFGFGEAQVNELGLFTYQSGLLQDGTSTFEPTRPIPVYAHGQPPELFTATSFGEYTVSLNLDTTLRVVRETGDFDKVTLEYFLRVNDEAPTLLYRDQDNDAAGPYERNATAQLDTNLQLQIDDKVYLYGQLTVEDVSGNALGDYSFPSSVRTNAGSFLRITAATRTRGTFCEGLLAYEALERTLGSITDTPRPLYSEFFGRTDTSTPYAQDGPGSLLLLTDSWRVRNFPAADKPFTFSFQELYNALDAEYCLGMGTEVRNGRQVIRIEPRAHFYQAQQGLALGPLNELKKSVASEYIFNTVQVGYEAWKSNSENGLAELNASRTYTLPITNQKNVYEAMSKVSASGYLLEQTRRDQYSAKPDKENTGDGTLFMISLRRASAGGFVPERNEAFAQISGVLSPTETYNLRLSPARMLRRHAAWLHAGVLRQEGRAIVLAEAEGNTRVITRLQSEAAPVVEKADLLVDELPAPFFFAEVYEGTTTLRAAQLRQLRAKPYQLISFEDERGNRLSGFVVRAEIAPASRRATLTLLRYV